MGRIKSNKGSRFLTYKIFQLSEEFAILFFRTLLLTAVSLVTSLPLWGELLFFSFEGHFSRYGILRALFLAVHSLLHGPFFSHESWRGVCCEPILVLYCQGLCPLSSWFPALSSCLLLAFWSCIQYVLGGVGLFFSSCLMFFELLQFVVWSLLSVVTHCYSEHFFYPILSSLSAPLITAKHLSTVLRLSPAIVVKNCWVSLFRSSGEIIVSATTLDSRHLSPLFTTCCSAEDLLVWCWMGEEEETFVS